MPEWWAAEDCEAGYQTLFGPVPRLRVERSSHALQACAITGLAHEAKSSRRELNPLLSLIGQPLDLRATAGCPPVPILALRLGLTGGVTTIVYSVITAVISSQQFGT